MGACYNSHFIIWIECTTSVRLSRVQQLINRCILLLFSFDGVNVVTKKYKYFYFSGNYRKLLKIPRQNSLKT
jgi:hypothetical protein